MKEYFKSSKQNESSRSRRQWRTRRGVEEVKTHGSRGLLLSAASKVKVTKALNAMEDDGGREYFTNMGRHGKLPPELSRKKKKKTGKGNILAH